MRDSTNHRAAASRQPDECGRDSLVKDSITQTWCSAAHSAFLSSSYQPGLKKKCNSPERMVTSATGPRGAGQLGTFHQQRAETTAKSATQVPSEYQIHGTGAAHSSLLPCRPPSGSILTGAFLPTSAPASQAASFLVSPPGSVRRYYLPDQFVGMSARFHHPPPRA